MQAIRISIHAPREGCDNLIFICLFVLISISIHAPREGCDCCLLRVFFPFSYFNPRTP